MVRLTKLYLLFIIIPILFATMSSPIYSSPFEVSDIVVRELRVILDSNNNMINISVLADVRPSYSGIAEYVFTNANISELNRSLSLPSEWVSALKSFLDRGIDYLIRAELKGTVLTLSLIADDLLDYIVSDKALYSAYMNIRLNASSPNSCMSLLGRTGFQMYLIIPDSIRKLALSEGIITRFEIRSSILSRDSLNIMAASIASSPPSNVSVSDTGIIIEQRVRDSDPAVCIPYTGDFWDLFGVPRVVFVIPNMPLEVGSQTFIFFEVSRVPIDYVEIRYQIPEKQVFSVMFPPNSQVEKVVGGYKVLPPDNVSVQFSYDNGTVVIKKIDMSATNLFYSHLYINITGFGKVDLGEATVKCCVAGTGTCYSSTVPIYSLTSDGDNTIVIPPPAISVPGISGDIRTWVVLGVVAFGVLAYALRQGRKV